MRTRAGVTTPCLPWPRTPFPGSVRTRRWTCRRSRPATEQQIRDLLVSRDFDAWSEALARVGNCSRPIRLRGRSETIDTITGEVLSSYSSELEPLGVTHVRCGNRRARVCPSCSRLYAADMFHLIRAGVAGGKTASDPLSVCVLPTPGSECP